MPTDLWRRAKQVFEEALERPSTVRQRYLESACGDDPELRQVVDDLIAADLSEGALPEPAMGDMVRALDEEQDRLWVGRCLGAYRITARLGHGGMGSVFLGERTDAEFRKQVAVKLLPLWLSSSDNLRRFRLERQILAMLEHPNIARLLDGGTTEEGLPYLVMEYVEGRPMTVACDEQRLTVRQRIEHFRKVCDAVSFAHQNLVVHRDLKPGNILMNADGVPKLLDFGIAKLLDGSIFPESSGLTRTHQRLLTPDYASPEQITGRPTTTATDVYSLGVVLYELLTGSKPFTRDGRPLRKLEEDVTTLEPPRPSAIVVRPVSHGGGAAAPSDPAVIASNRRSRSQALSRQLAGDLDNIVLRALRVDPDQRYGSARELADDLRRYLVGLPVEARPAGWLYRLSKFVRRHAVGTTVALAGAAVTVSFSVVTYLQTLRIAAERDHAKSEQARAEQIARLLVESFELADPSWGLGGQVTAREILENGARQVSRELADRPELEATMLHTIGKVQTRLGLYDRARPLLEKSLATRIDLLGEAHPAVAESLHEWSNLLLNQGELEEAEKAALRALEIRRRSSSPEAAESLHLLAEIRRNQGRREEAVRLHEQALQMQRATLGTRRPEYVRGLTQLALSLRLHGDRERAEELYREALAAQRELGRNDHPLTAQILKDLSRLLSARKEFAAAESLSREALEMNRRLFGEQHPTIAASLSALAGVELELGRAESAESLYAEALDMQRKLLSADNPKLASAIYNLALVQHRELHKLEQAERLYREAIDVFRGAFGEEHLNMGFFLLGLGGVLNDRGRPREAEPLLLDALDLFTRLSRDGAGGRNAAMVKSELAETLIALERHAEAEELLRACLPVLEESLGREHPSTRRARDRLARLYRETGRTDPGNLGE